MRDLVRVEQREQLGRQRIALRRVTSAFGERQVAAEDVGVGIDAHDAHYGGVFAMTSSLEFLTMRSLVRK